MQKVKVSFEILRAVAEVTFVAALIAVLVSICVAQVLQ